MFVGVLYALFLWSVPDARTGPSSMLVAANHRHFFSSGGGLPTHWGECWGAVLAGSMEKREGGGRLEVRQLDSGPPLPSSPDNAPAQYSPK